MRVILLILKKVCNHDLICDINDIGISAITIVALFDSGSLKCQELRYEL